MAGFGPADPGSNAADLFSVAAENPGGATTPKLSLKEVEWNEKEKAQVQERGLC